MNPHRTRVADRRVSGILLLYHHPARHSAPTIMEHVESFERNSRYKVWKVNTDLGFPGGLKGLRFETVVLHYSLFGIWPYRLDRSFLAYLDACEGSHKIAFFQDEYRQCQQRFRFLNERGIDCVYTLLKPELAERVYGANTRIREMVHTLTGYVSAELQQRAAGMTRPDSERTVDIGYRARPLDFALGRGAQEKQAIGLGFARRAAGLGLTLDIETDESRRIYGSGWYEFLASCRAVLGVEAGVSIFDLNGEAEAACAALLAESPNLSFDEVDRRVLHRWEGNIPYRTVSPRHFEAAALRVCQILFEGEYSGVLEPMVHYIPLRKDFSNFDEVIRIFRDPERRTALTENAYRDIVRSGRYSYAQFIREFDERLLARGLADAITADAAAQVSRLLDRGAKWRRLRTLVAGSRPGRLLLRLRRKFAIG